MSVTPPGPRNRFLWADPGACLPPGKAPPQRLLGLSFPVSSMIKKAKQTRMSHLRMSRLGLWQRATCRLGASTPKPASNQTRLRASVRAVSFNHVTEEHGRLQAGGGGHGTYEAGQAAGGFHALAASPPPRVSRRRPVRGCPWPPSPGHRARRGPPGAANSGRARHAWVHPPKEQRGRVSPLRACASARGHPQTGPGCPTVVPGQAACGGAEPLHPDHTWVVRQDLWQVTAPMTPRCPWRVRWRGPAACSPRRVQARPRILAVSPVVHMAAGSLSRSL